MGDKSQDKSPTKRYYDNIVSSFSFDSVSPTCHFSSYHCYLPVVQMTILSSDIGNIPVIPRINFATTNGTHPIYGTRKSTEIGTIIGNNRYFIDYTAASSKFSDYLPIIQEMINSFEVINQNYDGQVANMFYKY